MIGRREFLGFVGAAAAFPRAALGQQASKVPVIAWLSIPLNGTPYVKSFKEGLADYGYVEGATVDVEYFTAPATADLPQSAVSAVAGKPDLLVAYGTSAGLAAKAATKTIPIVFTNSSDPLTTGLVASLARPGGNVTGNTSLVPDLIAKSLAIAKEVLPKMKRMGVLNLPDVLPTAEQMPEIVGAAKALGVDGVVIDFQEGPDFASQFDQVVAAGVQAVWVTSSTYFQNNADLLFQLQIKNHLPLFSSAALLNGENQPFVSLVSYGPNGAAEVRRSASFVDAILKGAVPSDLPVEGPTVFDFAVNLTAAKALGITIPPSILAQATIVTP